MKSYKRLVIFNQIEKKNKKENYIFYNQQIKNKFKSNHIIKKNIVIAKPYGLTNKQIINDHLYLYKCYTHFLKELSNRLNIIHTKNYSVRYWEIIVGHWLRSFLWTIFNRFQTIELIKKKQN